jgi:hypothetical protein
MSMGLEESVVVEALRVRHTVSSVLEYIFDGVKETEEGPHEVLVEDGDVLEEFMDDDENDLHSQEDEVEVGVEVEELFVQTEPKLNEDTELTIDGVLWKTPLGASMTWNAAKQMLRNPTGDIDEYISNRIRE